MTPRTFRRLFARSALAAAACLALSRGHAQEPLQASLQPPPDSAEALTLLEQLVGLEVESASKYSQNTLDAPAQVMVVRQEEIRAKGYQTLSDVLQAVPGLYVTGDRAYLALGVRGLNLPGDYNVRTLTLIDGYRVNDVVYDQAQPEYEQPVVAQWIKRLEFVAGPSSSMYGGNALFGIANVVTLDGADAPGMRIEVARGSFNSRRVVGQYGAVLPGGQDLFVGVAAYGNDGETLSLQSYGTPDNPNGRVAGLEDMRYGALMAKYRDGAWRAKLAGSHRLKGQATAPYGTRFGADGTEYTDTNGFLDVSWDPGASGDWHPQGRVSLSHYRYGGRYVYEPEEEGLPDAVNYDVAEAQWLSAEYRSTWRGLVNHTIVLGVEGRYVLQARLRNFDRHPAATYLDHLSRPARAGVFVQDQYRFSERWSLTGGLRLDGARGDSAELSPRAALVWRPGESSAFKLLAGRAFRSPNLSERFYEDGGVTQLPNPDLEHEHITTVELAMEQALNETTRMSATLYRYQLHGLIELVPVSDDEDEQVYRNRNMGAARATGGEIELEHARGNGLQLRGSLALQNARSEGRRLSNSPRWLAKGSLVAPLAASLQGALELRAMGLRWSGDARVRRHVVANATLRYAVTPANTLQLRVTNLGDVHYDDPSTPALADDRIRQPRRQFELSWQARF
ncbi:TonB-dependent receptor [Aquabacterium sp. A7-Y]|uniref:TonB-dependent receptor plug domain-containing protein n=1 Tax=Aquabacterium sp. A7-Y TaxID=1349605 RepID=UPI00223E73DD|nr:TonB-dependent receptor [Aquabacterium sp. A7-Y]MCW7536638.1 TonB-dependent receptor [Aquabacterium sp. A7-Y]